MVATDRLVSLRTHGGYQARQSWQVQLAIPADTPEPTRLRHREPGERLPVAGPSKKGRAIALTFLLAENSRGAGRPMTCRHADLPRSAEDRGRGTDALFTNVVVRKSS